MPGFLSNLTQWARKILEESEGPPEDGTSDFDIRTKALTRPAYTEQLKPTGMTSRLKFESGEDVFAGARPSAVPTGVYVRYQMSVDNQARAAEARAERQERDSIREEMERQEQQETADRRERGREVHRRTKNARQNLAARNVEKGRAAREERAEHDRIMDARLEQRQQDHADKLKREGNADARMDAAEEEAANEVRRQAQEERHALTAAVFEKKKQVSETNRAAAEARKMENAARLAHALAARDRFKAASAEQLRLDSQNQLRRLSVEHDEYLKRGRQIQTRIKKERLERKDMQVERLLEKQRRHEGHRAKIDKQHAANNEEYFAETQRKRNEIFQSRYVAAEAAQAFESSAFRKLHSMDDKAEAEIAVQNLEILERIENVEQRTDDLLDDDAAGEARYTFAVASEERRQQERASIAKGNAKHRQRIENAQPMVDDLLDDEAAFAKRSEMAAASQERLAAEAQAAAENFEQLQQRVENVAPATDDLLDDDAAGEARQRFKQASRARKRAEAERIAKSNAEMHKRIARVTTSIDDDITDEAAYRRREDLQENLEEKRALKKEQIKLKREQDKLRLANVQAVVDDDIGDEAAGIVRRQSQSFKRRQSMEAAAAQH